MPENSLLLSRADAAVLSRDYALAARLYTSLLKERPDDKELLMRLGNVFIKSGDDKKALPIYEKLHSLDSASADFLLALGGIYRRVQMYDKSVQALNSALDSGAPEAQVYYNLGFTYKFQEKYEDAIDCFETVVTLNPGDVLAYNHIGSIYELKKEYDAAIQAYQMGLKADPNHPILHFNLAKALADSGKLDASVREYEAALRYKPGWKEAYVEYSRLLFKSGKLKEAEAVVEQAMKVNEDSARLQSLMGDIYMAEDYYDGAEDSYNKSLKADPKRLKALLGLARSLEAQGKNAEALDAIYRAKEIAPDDDAVSKESASIHLSARKLSAANKEIKALFEKDRDDVETLDLAAQYYICADDEKSAGACYKKIESRDPSYKAHLSNASKRYRQKGDLKKAQAYIKKFLAQVPKSNSRAYVALAQIEEGLGNLTEALAACNKALDSNGENRMAKKAGERIASSIGTKAQEHEEAHFDSVEKAPASEEDLNSGFGDLGGLEIDMGQEELSAQEGAAEDAPQENELSLEDDFDFDAFGKSPLLDEEGDLDFASIEIAPDEANDMGLLEDESENALKEKIEEPELSDTIPLNVPQEEIDEGGEDIPQEEAPLEAELAQKEEPEALAQTDAPPPAKNSAPREDEGGHAEKPAPLMEAGADLADKMARIEESAKKASDAAEKAWYAAQMAADNAQAAEQSQEALAERMEQMADDAKSGALDDATKKASAMIPAIENILRQDSSERDFSSEIQMFKALRGLSDSLSQEERREFMQSRTRVSLDYLISKLEGRPGLLKTSAALRKSGELLDCVLEENVKTDYSLDELARIVVTDMKALSGYLKEDDLVVALNALADSLLN